MSTALRAVIVRYRREPSPRPDRASHARDDLGITHAMETDERRNRFSSCGRQISDTGDDFTILAGTPRTGARVLVPTWDEVDCMACIVARAA